ncbi:hypothetical protein FOZ63_031283 [Perkinsus olseni]|uniref:Peptidase A1 domain-containing protein n=1 Tax=Perkinsus olseni TaxID=32597 RepID=A0A7J6PV63_PEROL|nr:hypothetical protein FOZ63_031283 [Perkinsus olseni]
MSVIRILSLVSLVIPVEPEPITLPLTSGRVPLSFDGQALNFELDSGSAMSFAFFGPLYEKAYGKGSCQRSRYGCYVCPSDNPCDDILSRERWEEEFSDGEIYEYVEHAVTLSVGNHTIEGFKVGLVVEYPTHYRRTPSAMLGFSIGNGIIPETFLEQLKRRRVIMTLSYSIHGDQQGLDLSGILTIGDTKTATAPYIALSKRAFAHGILAVPLGRLKLLDSLGNQVEKRRKRGKAKLAVVDTGAMSLFVSEGDFEYIIEMTWEEMRKDEAGLSIPKKGQLLCESTWVRMVRKEALPYLPTLGYKI